MIDDLGPADITLEGRLGPDQERRYTYADFEMPEGVGQFHLRYDYDHPISADPTVSGGNTLDIGLFDQQGTAPGGAGFRGWSGSSKRALTIGERWATPPYRAGAIEPGRWQVLLGPYKIGPAGLRYRVEIWLNSGLTDSDPIPDFVAPRIWPRTAPAEPGWVRAELHCHTRFSDGASWHAEVLGAAAAAGIEVLAITDHNSAKIVRSPDERTPLLLPGVEVTTYGGHWNAWGGEGWYEFRQPTAEATQEAMHWAIAGGAFVSINHPKPFGPSWDYPGVMGYHAVDVWNGPWAGRNAVALAYWEALLRQGKRIVAVGGSDTHVLDGQARNPAAPRLGQPTTWIGLQPGEPRTVERVLAALKAGRCFVAASPAGPQLYVSRQDDGISVRVLGGEGAVLMVLDQFGAVEASAIETGDQTVAEPFPAGSSYVRAQLVDSSGGMLAISNPVWQEDEIPVADQP